MADIDAPLAWRMQQDGYLMQINQLRDEVERLKRDEWGEGFRAGCDAVNDALEDGADYYRDEITRLKAENAELRELVRELYDFTGVCEDSLPSAWDHYERRMRELGVEVGDA